GGGAGPGRYGRRGAPRTALRRVRPGEGGGGRGDPACHGVRGPGAVVGPAGDDRDVPACVSSDLRRVRGRGGTDHRRRPDGLPRRGDPRRARAPVHAEGSGGLRPPRPPGGRRRSGRGAQGPGPPMIGLELVLVSAVAATVIARSEERRVGKEGGCRAVPAAEERESEL